MNVIVKLDSLLYEQIKEHGDVSEFHKLILNDTPIPDNATNLDVMRTMFKLVEMRHWDYKDSRCFFVDPDFPGNQNDLCVTHEWCGATYKGWNNEEI